LAGAYAIHDPTISGWNVPFAPAADIVEEVGGLTVWDGARRRTRVSSFVLRQALVIRDRDRIYGIVVTRRLRAMGIRDKPTAPASPWQNGYAERLLGSIRHECLDHVIVLGEAHLRRVLKSYAHYYNGVRTHRSLNKDAPVCRSVQRAGVISSRAILGGLHHHYGRI
jgi:transposase InsO family protein